MQGGRFRGLDEAPPVPTTSILTKTDGIVHWRGSVQKPATTPAENIEVYASHCGLGVNPSVMVAMANEAITMRMPSVPGWPANQAMPASFSRATNGAGNTPMIDEATAGFAASSASHFCPAVVRQAGTGPAPPCQRWLAKLSGRLSY